MKKFTIVLILLFGAVWMSQAQNGKCNVTYQGKLIFINSVPSDAYTVVGKAKYANSKKNEEATIADVSGIHKSCLAIDDVLKKVSKGKHPDFDAAIVYSEIKIELIKFSSGTPSDACNYNAKNYIKKCGSKVIYFLGLPSGSYDVVKTIEVTNFTNLGQLKMGKSAIDNFMNKLYESSCKEAKDGVDFDAIILDDPEMATKKGFVGGRTIQLVKIK